MAIKDKVVIITGASSGIGEATARLLASKGAKLVLGARREEHLRKLVDEIVQAGGEAVYHVTDVTKIEDNNKLVELAKEKFGRVDVIFLNAGVMPNSPLSKLKTKDWRTDVVMMAHHLRYLQKHYWKTKYSVNFPRMRPAQNEGFQPNCFMTDKQLAQATFAMRIFDHDVDISYSTREPAYIRDNMATLGVTTMSAESKVNPGGYHTYPQALEQFTVSDERTAKVINARLKELGREPVWKDWDASFDFFGNIANG